jgi:arsenate reductase (thioredoxin)
MTRRVVFVCVENSNRSQMAEAFARLHGGDQIEAYSAGSRPSGRVNPQAIEFMREKGYDLAGHVSKGLIDLPAIEFDVVVGMGCGDEGCPVLKARRREEWDIPDPKNLPPDEFRAVRDRIEEKVEELLASMKDQGQGAPALDKVQEASEESFPASDAPGWTPIVTLGAPHRNAKW